MQPKSYEEQCADLSSTLSIEIPCVLADRVTTYAKEHETTISNVLIEALDIFLRTRENKK